ncbi:hypothetical protein HHI36_004866 [Cryptolaemus montrouzieri]|uniref:Uncharacterized protein n=1 Tax=Cryptolaemus montrouzieri TaxID=559131 RepID=A0ABD2NU08_9CUCU
MDIMVTKTVNKGCSSEVLKNCFESLFVSDCKCKKGILIIQCNNKEQSSVKQRARKGNPESENVSAKSYAHVAIKDESTSPELRKRRSIIKTREIDIAVANQINHCLLDGSNVSKDMVKSESNVNHNKRYNTPRNKRNIIVGANSDIASVVAPNIHWLFATKFKPSYSTKNLEEFLTSILPNSSPEIDEVPNRGDFNFSELE